MEEPPSLDNISEIIIANVLETFYKSYVLLSPQERSYSILYDALEGNRALFYNDDNKVVVTSTPIDEEYIQKTKKIMGWKNVVNLSPKVALPSICEDLIRKGRFGDKVEEIIRRNPGVSLIPYRATPEFYNLVEHLKKKKLKFKLPETMDFDLSFANGYSNTKRGFRHLFSMALQRNMEGDIDIPRGFITANKIEAVDAVWWLYKNGKGSVIKYNKGTQGRGIIILKKSEIPSQKDKLKRKLAGLLNDKIWDEPIIIVEELIDVDKTKLGGSPSVEFFVDVDGKVHPLYAGEQILALDGKTFMGFYIHPGIVNNEYIKTAYEAGRIFGMELAELGYKGFYDVDLVISKNKRLYAVESNLRRTGGTHIHQAAVNLLGEDYAKYYHVTGEDVVIPEKIKLSYEQCHEILGDLEFDPETKEGFVYANPSMLQVNILHIITIAKTEKKLKSIRSTLWNRLSKKR